MSVRAPVEAAARRATLRDAQRVVVKLGSAALCEAQGGVDVGAFARVAAAIAEQRRGGRQVVVVSSGAVALGRAETGQAPGDPSPRFGRQALAAIGQPLLMAHWRSAFAEHGLGVAQLLLTHADLGARPRFLHARRVAAELLEHGVVPIVNENDTVAIEELGFGDNDALAAQVAVAVGAELLVLLTEVDGLMTADPRLDPTATRVPHLDAFDPRTAAFTEVGSRSTLGTGGMRSKMQAAAIAAHAGIATLVADARRADVLAALISGADVGTLLWPGPSRLSARRKWLATTVRPRGSVSVDAGAARALVEGGRSLLPVGVRAVEGRFEVGDPVRVLAPDGSALGRGLVRYASEDARAIAGLRTDAVTRQLGWLPAAELIHRDDFWPEPGAARRLWSEP